MDAPKCKLCETRHWGLCGPDRKRANAQLALVQTAARPKRKPPKAKARNARRPASAA